MPQNIIELEKFDSINKLYEMAQEGKPVDLSNVKGGLQGFIAVSLFNQAKQHNQNALFIAPTDAEARAKYSSLRRFSDDVVYLPPEQSHSYFSDAFSLVNIKERQSTLLRVLEPKPVLTICSIESLLKKLPKVDVYITEEEIIRVGEEFGFDNLINLLNRYGYERNYITEAPGQYSVRGGIVDVYLITQDNPVRIDFFDDDVDSIKKFDASTQRSIEEIEQITVSPLNENWLSKEEREEAKNKLEQIYKNNELFLNRFDIVDEGGLLADGILFPFTNPEDSFIDYLKADYKQDPIIIWSDPVKSENDAKEYLTRIESDYQILATQGDVFPDEKYRYFTYDQIKDIIDRNPLVKLYLFDAPVSDEEIIDMDSKTLESFAGHPQLLKEFLDNRLNNDYFVHFFARNERGLEKLKNYLQEIDIDITEPTDENIPGVRFSIGEISEGFELARDKVIFFNESDFFKEPKRKRRTNSEDTKKIDHFTDLKIGDYVVHDEYGIGIYKGLIQMDIGGGLKDMMHILYDNDDVLYIPIEQMDQVQVYIGTGGDEKPAINELGSKKWTRAKRKAKKAAEDMADELIKLYSKRESMPGYAFPADSVEQRDFEEAFPFQETDDQLLSIEEIKKDMEKPTSMDRLLCGDVGYGKTEVAFRAAFKAAMDGKQTAILVPTTVLSQQHFQSAVERFKDFPINIDVLSRFKSTKEQKEAIERLKSGETDIIIGTHRLLSKDVEFKNLGLLVVDEEQRFGVRSKERIKQMKENIDVLTLSATPIPRTLHMSLTGVRDMSVLEEPPHGRRPVQTYVMKYSEPIIKDAIERELARNGQIYYLHNRVEDIEEVTEKLSRLVPEARIVYAHGQMKPKELEDIMSRFLNNEFDILVSTTIIENGLDVQNANTMIVEDGDMFGLSQLYQLRGRVGRSPRQAYTYITHNKYKLNEDAEKRLKALKDFTSFGSGFKIALRDLEIRGAGNILGKQQSGHMASVGYELYTRILEQTIQEHLTGIPAKEIKDANVHINIEAYVPKGYIIGDQIKYQIYKKMASLHSWEGYDDLYEELEDRFGPIPQPIKNLMMVAMIKNVASRIGMSNVTLDKNRAKFTFNSSEEAYEASQAHLKAGSKNLDLRMNDGTSKRPAWVINYNKKLSTEQILGPMFNFLNTIYQEEENNKGDQK